MTHENSPDVQSVHDNRTYLVRLPSGVVLQMTQAEYDAMWKGVDPLAVKVLGKPC